MSFRKWLHDLLFGSEPMTDVQKEMAEDDIPPPPNFQQAPRTGEPKQKFKDDEW